MADAGLLLPATLMRRLGLGELLRERVNLGEVPGHANVGLKGSAVWAALLGGRSGSATLASFAAKVLGHWVAAA